MTTSADIVICGAGIAGVATAYQLAVVRGLRNIVIIDERPPLTLTSDKSTECYRNWWPGPGDAMVALMNRSIDILEQIADDSGNRIALNRRGYLYATANPARTADFERAALEAEALGAGALRRHAGQPGSGYQPLASDGFRGQPTGADLITDPQLLGRHFGYLAKDTVAVVHARRCGWFSAQQLGMTMLERAREHGVRFVSGRMTGVDVAHSRVRAVRLGDGTRITTDTLVLAAGPLQQAAARMLGIDLPMFCERHIKIMFDDFLGIVPRDAPLLIWTDPIRLAWSDEERELFASDPELRHLLEEFPSGVHTRPEGGSSSHMLLILWTYDAAPVEPTWPLPLDPHYPEIALRGLARMIPGLSAYFGRAPKPQVDGGYYAKTRENRPLIGPLPIDGAYIVGALSGYGLMAACGAADLCASTISGGALPHYAPAFRLDRYADPAYRRLLDNWGESGQL
ncbi:MAG: FAD-binding oxidoreductase [Chloroflexi bacterium]|nr:FAD-binding oxidoreductase [Chloroflexota bacterium]